MTASQPDAASGAASAPDAMPESLYRLLENVIDYAGLFPPAALDMAETVANYARHSESPESWMLERLVVPAARLEEFEQHADGRLATDEEAEPWPISCLVRPAGDLEGLAEDLEAIARFNDRHCRPADGLSIIDVVELKAGSVAELDSALDAMPDEVFPFFELPPAGDLRGFIATLVGSDAGAKIRTGGPDASLFPAPDVLAEFIVACARADVPFKATAGLHHPLRHENTALGCEEFGFLNVFVAGVLAQDHDLDADEVEALLVERSIDAFTFGAESLSWRGHEVDVDRIEDARLAFAISFGSCSFDEPVADLRSLGLL